MICYFNNKCFPAIPISSIFNIYINEIGTYSVFFCLQVLFSSTNSYCIKHVYSFLDHIPSNRHIYSILYINQNGKLLFVIIRIYPNNNVKNVWSRYLQQWLVEGWILSNIYLFLFNKFVIIIYVICSSNLLLYHFIQSFPFIDWSRLITGFTIHIYRRETKAVIFHH